MSLLSSPLIRAFQEHPLGLCGAYDPVKIVGSVEAIEQRLAILTLGVVLDTKHLNQERWSALVSIHDHWLLDPSQVAYRTSAEVLTAMREEHISGPPHIARVWWQVCRGVQGRFKGSWRDLLKANDDMPGLQSYLQDSKPLPGPVGTGHLGALVGPGSPGWWSGIERLGISDCDASPGSKKDSPFIWYFDR
jgi:hypothetical protein